MLFHGYSLAAMTNRYNCRMYRNRQSLNTNIVGIRECIILWMNAMRLFFTFGSTAIVINGLLQIVRSKPNVEKLKAGHIHSVSVSNSIRFPRYKETCCCSS